MNIEVEGECLKGTGRMFIPTIHTYIIKKYYVPSLIVLKDAIKPTKLAEVFTYTQTRPITRFNPNLRIYSKELGIRHLKIYSLDKRVFVGEISTAKVINPTQKCKLLVDFTNRLIRIEALYCIGGWVRF